MSLWAATVVLMFREWALTYSELTQLPRYKETSENHARRKVIFARGILGPYISWEGNHDTAYLHFSLLLFIAGSLIYLFNINRAVFYAVVWWVGYMMISYTGATVSVFFKPHHLFFTPLSMLVFRVYCFISYVVSQVCSCMPPLHGLHDSALRHYGNLRDLYGEGFIMGKVKEADKAASKQSWEIDAIILDRIIPYLDEDHEVEAFLNAIPGYCNSKSTDSYLPPWVRKNLRQLLAGFLYRTFSSRLISESDRTGRFIICSNAAHAALAPHDISEIFNSIFKEHRSEALQFIEKWDSLIPLGLSQNHDRVRKIAVASIIPLSRDRDDRWIKLVKETFDVPDHIFLDYLAHGDSALLSVLIYVSCRASSWSRPILLSLSKFDVRNTLPGLQHDFCAMWNDIVQDARNLGHEYSPPVDILHDIRHVYIALHQSTDAAPTAFSASTENLDSVLAQPSSYPLCDVASHRPDPIPHFPVPLLTPPADSLSTHDGSTILRQVEGATTVAGAPSPIILSGTKDNFLIPAPTSPASPVPTSSHSTDASPPGTVVVALGVSPAAALSHLPEGTAQRDIVAIRSEPDYEVLSTTSAPVPTLASASTSIPPVLNKSLVSYSAGTPTTPHLLLPTSSVVDFPTPVSPPQSPVPPLPNAELLALLSSATVAAASFGPTSNATRPGPRVRGLANSGSVCFANATLQLLVYSPPFWDLFRELGDLNAQRGAGDPGTGSRATPLVDATVRFFEEFRSEEKEPLPTQQPPQQAARGKLMEGEEEKQEPSAADPFEPLFMYNAMKEKRQLKHLLVRSYAMLRPAVPDPCWPNVYRMANSRTRKSFSAFTSTRLTRSCSDYSLLLVAASRLLLYLE